MSELEEDGDDAPVLALRVGPEEAVRLDLFLARRLKPEGHSRTAVQGWIDDARARVFRAGAEERGVKRSFPLEPGDEVLVRPPPPKTPPGPLLPEALPVPILHQDEALLVLDKPAGLTVHPGAGQRTGTLANALLHLSPGRLSGLGGEERPGIVHRLDKETSGVIAIARTDAAHRELARQFHDREVEKVYLALVTPPPEAEGGLIDLAIGRDPRDRKRMTAVHARDRRRQAPAREACTAWSVLERFPRAALLELRPRTGRTHQLRVHLRAIGCPIAADATYGRAPPFTTADAGLPGEPRPLLGRTALHAARLTLTHPVSGLRVTFEAPLPDDLRSTLETLRGPHK